MKRFSVFGFEGMFFNKDDRRIRLRIRFFYVKVFFFNRWYDILFMLVLSGS